MRVSNTKGDYSIICSAQEINDILGCVKNKISLIDALLPEAPKSIQFDELIEQRKRLLSQRDELFDSIRGQDFIKQV